MSNTAAQGLIKRTIERIERIRQERADLEAAEREVFAEAKAAGLDVAVLKKVLAKRAKDPAQLAEEAALVELYEDAAK
jgi:uncharacterized protein (UPF0335 family)